MYKRQVGILQCRISFTYSIYQNSIFFQFIHNGLFAFDQPPLTRKERANNVKKRNYFGKYEGKAREVLEALLDKYAENGILDFEKANILEIPPFNSIGKPTKIIKLFGGKVAFEQAIRELEYQIYKSA